MNDETRKYLIRVIEKLEEITAKEPFLVRDRVKEFTQKLKDATKV